MQPDQHQSTERSNRALLIVIALGLLARIVLMLTSWGTVDADVWQIYGHAIRTAGIVQLVQTQPSFNHPPLPGYWAAIAEWLTEHSPFGSAVSFATIFKLPIVLADCASCWLVYLAVRDRAAARSALIAAALYAWCPAAIVVSAYHCNTDAIYAMLALLSAWMLTRGKPLSAGVALGAAINVKLIPTTLIIPLLLSCRDRRAAGRFIAGLAIASVPCVVMMLILRGDFVRNTIAYSPPVDAWGFMMILTRLARIPRWSAMIGPVIISYSGLAGRAMIFATIALASLIARRRRLDPIRAAAIGAAIYLALAPGFGIHHAIFALPLMFATRPKFAAVSGVLIGAMQIAVYTSSIVWTLPTRSTGLLNLHGAAMWIGLFAWISLAVFAATSFRKPVASRPHPENP